MTDPVEELVRALEAILPMAREGQRARVSPSSHQDFIQDDLDDIHAAERAISRFNAERGKGVWVPFSFLSDEQKARIAHAQD